MAKLDPMVDMKLDKEEQEEINSPSPPMYPYGLCISLCTDELEKLGIDVATTDVGAIFHLHCLAKATSKSMNDSESGVNSRLELQIIAIAAESEDDENEESDNKLSGKKIVSKLYTA